MARSAAVLHLVAAVLLAHAPHVLAATPPDGWQIRLEARHADVVDRGQLTVGASSVSVDGRDDFDDPYRPVLPSRFVGLFTEHRQDQAGWEGQELPELQYRAQYDAPLGTAGRQVEIVLQTDATGPVALSWAIGADFSVARHFLVLRDTLTGATVDMWTQTAYVLDVVPGRRILRIEMTGGRAAPPIAHDQLLTTNEDTPLPIALTAADAEGDPLTFRIASAPSHGALAGAPPNVTYTPDPNFLGSDSFSFVANDGQADSSPGTVSITVLSVNDAPVAQAQSVTTDEDTAVAITLAGTDVDGDPLTFEIAAPPARGTLTGTAPDLTYTPAADFYGTDSFTFRATDGQALSVAATVTVTVQPVNDPPVAGFTVPGVARNVALWENNVGSHFEGAAIVAFSSQQNTSTTPVMAIDDNANSRWTSVQGQNTNQFLTVALPGAESRQISAIRLLNGDGSLQGVKSFDVLVSNATLAESDFTTVLTDVALDNNRIQEFPLPAPMPARYVKLLARSNWGSTCCVSIRSLEVISTAQSGVASHYAIASNAALLSEAARITRFSSQNSTSFRPDLAIDGNSGTRWASASGQNASQFFVVELGKGKLYSVDRVRLQNPSGTAGQSVRDFRIEVSATTDDDTSFITAFSGRALDVTSVQEFVFPGGPVDARYVKLFVLNNSGSTCCVSLAELQVPPRPAGVASFSSYNDASGRPELLADGVASTAWISANGRVTDEFVELRVAEANEQLIDRVRIQPWVGATAEAIRDFEVWVSATTDDDAAFTRVLTGTVLNSASLQEFLIPGGALRARFVKLVARNNHGSASFLRVASFEAVAAASEGNIVSLPAPPLEVTGNESPAQTANGATVVASSGQVSGHGPANMLDYVAGLPWATQGLANQFVTLQLGGAGPHLLSGVRVSPRVDTGADQSVKDFEIWVSDTTSNDAAFTQVLTATVLNDGTLQTFAFPGGPVPARFVKYRPLNNYGSTANISTSNFDVVALGAGGVVAATSQSSFSLRPEAAIDGSTSTTWRTRTGLVTNQALTLRLAGGLVQPLYGVSVHAESSFGPRDVEVKVSSTTSEDAAFTTVFTGTLPQVDERRELYFSALTSARFVQFVWKTGYNTSFIGVREVEALRPPTSGAVLVGFSSQSGATTAPLRALDFDRTNGPWNTASNQNTNQFVKVLLPRGETWIVDHVALQPRPDCCADQSPRGFELQISATGWADDDFTTVAAGTLRNDGSLQHFYFPPLAARAARLLLKNGYGSTSLALQAFWLFSPEIGSTEARFLERSLAQDGNLTAFAWTFGDGGSSTDRDPVHVFPGPGRYDVSLRVSDANGLADEHASTYEVFGAPVPNFTFTPAAPGEGASVTFTDTTTDPLGLSTREWRWGDGTASAFNQSPIGHVFTDNGTYPVTLVVANARGVSAEVTKPVSVANLPPTVNAGVDLTLVWGGTWALSSSVGDPGTQDRSSLTCRWDFGDGDSATINNCTSSNVRVPHAYALPGSYTATLTVTDKDGGSAVDALIATVNKRPTLVNIHAALDSTPGGEVTVAAKLLDRFEISRSMAGRTLSFTLGAQTVASQANADGLTTAVLTFTAGVTNTVSATFAGDGFYLPSADTDTFNPVLVFPETPSLRHEQSEVIAMVPSASGRFAHGGVLSTVGFSGGYAPLIQVVDPLVVASAAAPNPLPGFDTVALNGICDIGSNTFLGSSTFRSRVEEFVTRGGKLIIWDSECTSTDYSKFFLPFTTNNPGALGATGTLQIVEESTLASSDPASPAFINVGLIGTQTDAVGDANVFLTFDPNWCVGMKARNARIPEFMPTHTYAVLGRGLLIYSGLDRDGMQASATASPNTGSFFLAKIWERELKQAWNPSGLPCDVAATEAVIVLAPPTAVHDVGQTHTATMTVTATNGTPLRNVFVTLQSTGAHAFSQQLTTDENGVATFTYTGTTFGDDSLQARAGAITSNTATVHWNAAPTANAGPDQDGLTGTAVTLDGRASSDPNPADVLSFTWTQVGGPPVTLIDGQTALPRFTPTQAGDYVFQLVVSDGRLSDDDTVTVGVVLSNRPPLAQDQSVITDEDAAVEITLVATDVDGDVLTYTVLTQPAQGTLSGTAPNLTYTPEANYHGPDSFTFRVNDGTADSNVATVNVTVRPVNDVPVADDQSVTTDEDTAVAVTLTASDVDGDSLAYTVLTQPAQGTLSGTAPNLTYTPAAHYHGPDSFTFRVNDGTADSNVATVNITVRPVNDVPVATGAVATPSRILLWPPNHVWEPITVDGVTDVEGSAITITATSVRQDEPITGGGSGNTIPDATLSPLQVRIERQGPADGRFYHIAFTASDGEGGTCTGTVTVCVPHDQGNGPQCIDGGPLYNSLQP